MKEDVMNITTAGESHGKGLFCIIEGLPSGLTLDLEEISENLAQSSQCRR